MSDSDENPEQIDLVLTHSVDGHYESSVVLEPNTRYKATLTPVTEKPLNVRMAEHIDERVSGTTAWRMKNLLAKFDLVERSKVENPEPVEVPSWVQRWLDGTAPIDGTALKVWIREAVLEQAEPDSL